MIEKKYNVAIAGATGLVGRTMIKVLEERNFPVCNLTLLASERSAGEIIKFKDEDYIVKQIADDSFEDVDIALFSAGKDVSIKFGPEAVKSGCVVIDNGSYWRMNPNVPLVVPEVNPEDLEWHKGIIANPNCSTIQLMVPLKPIDDLYNLKRLVISTYQSITGAGQRGVDQLISEVTGFIPEERVTSHQVAYNLVFHKISDPEGFSEEEIKMINETRKILHTPELKVAVTCVRLPILGGHGESVNIETEKPFEISEIRRILSEADGLILVDEPYEEKYPTPLLSKDTNEVYVGRIRRDDTVDNGLYLWVVADNVRKGAATNAVQIAEKLIEKNLLSFQFFQF